jgi:hypothetical protein
VSIKISEQPVIGGILGIANLTGSVSAVASETATSGGSATGVLYALNPTANQALSSTNNGCLYAAGVVYVNSNSSSAIKQTGTGCSNGVAFNATSGGSIEERGGYSPGCCSPAPTSTSSVTDPLSAVVMPSYSGGQWSYPGQTAALTTQTVSGSTLNPGVYNGITLNGGTYTMNPGVYIIDGGGFNVNNTTSLTGNGVFIYNTNHSNPSGCQQWTMTATSSVSLSAPTTGTYKGIAVAQDRACATQDSLNSSGNLAIDGAFYAPAAKVTMTNTGAVTDTLQAMIIADTVVLDGSGEIALNGPDSIHNPNPSASVALVQ